jgi:hypothetical protein
MFIGGEERFAKERIFLKHHTFGYEAKEFISDIAFACEVEIFLPLDFIQIGDRFFTLVVAAEPPHQHVVWFVFENAFHNSAIASQCAGEVLVRYN